MTIDYPIPHVFLATLDKLKPHKILITGATSGLGRSAVQYLHHARVPCVATGRNQAVIDELIALGIEAIPLDLAKAEDRELQRLLQGVDIVWHCAALSSPWGKYHDFYQANVVATQKLAHAASRMGVNKFIHISTPSVYFNFSHRHDVRENDINLTVGGTFVNHYIHTKFLTEQFLQSLNKTCTMQFTILRPRAIFGPNDRVLLPKILAIYHAKKGKIPLPDGGKVLMDVTFADNVVYAMSLASVRDLAKHPLPVFNVSNQSPIRLYDLLTKLIHTNMGYPLSIKYIPYTVVATLAKILEKSSCFTNKEPKLTPYSAGVLHYDMTLNTQNIVQQLGYSAVYSQERAIAITAQHLLKPFRSFQ